MAKKKEEKKADIVLERAYNVPLRKEYMKAPRWKRTNKAVSALRKFLARHMKSEDIVIGKYLNLHLWKDGAKNPPHHVRVEAKKDSTGKVRAEIVGAPQEKPKEEKKPAKKETEKKEAAKEPEKPEQDKKENKLEKKEEAIKEEKQDKAKGAEKEEIKDLKKEKPAPRPAKEAPVEKAVEKKATAPQKR